MKLHKQILHTEESDFVVGGNAVFVRPLLVPVLRKGEAEDPSADLLGCFSCPQTSLLAATGAARQQLGCGGRWGRGAPDVQHFSFRAGREAPAQVAGAGAGRGGQGALAAVQTAGVVVR